MKFLIVLGLIFFNGCKVVPQSKNMIRVNNIIVYKDFQERGYTTAGAFAHFGDMIGDGVTRITISEVDKVRFEHILNNATINKHFQTKFGGNLLFCEMEISNQSTTQKVVITAEYIVYNKFGKIKEKRVLITNLTTMEEYIVTNSLDLQWLMGWRAAFG